MRNRFRSIKVARRSVAPAALVVALLGAACSDLTKVQAPGLIQRPQLTNATGAVTFFNGGVRNFYSAFNTEVLTSGTWADEFASAGVTNYADPRQYTQGAPLVLVNLYTPVQLARVQELQTLAVLQQSLPGQHWSIGEIYGFTAYLETFLAEQFCSGVPLSTIAPDFTPRLGGALTTAQLYQQALLDFDSALVYSTDSARILNMARVGLARVLLDIGQPANAAAAVASVPTTFTFNTEHSTAVNPNNLYFITNVTTVADGKGTNGLNYVTAADPRVPTTFVSKGVDAAVNVYRFAPITSMASPLTLASGVEARLIEAEAALAGGDATTWLAKLNTLRASSITPALAPLADPGTTTARVSLMFRERAFWLFASAHRAGDMRRLLRQYGFSLDNVYPIGSYKYGGAYLEQSVIPFDFTETINNPLLGGKQCIDQNP